MDKYEQIKILGEGSYGKALLVKSKFNNTLYVIKEVRFSNIPQKERDSAEQEVKILSSLDHPFIVSYIESFQENGYLYIVMEFADGGDLSKKIEKQNKKLFSENEILEDFLQIALAIKYIHDKKILHRDLKGENIFLMSTGQIKLGDFGISKVLDNTFQLCQTQIGTPYYLSPEICEGKSYNSKTDIWSLGCILYELCTLKHAFNANNMNALVMGIIRGKYTPISTQYSIELRNLVDKMLIKNPKNRPSINQILSLPFIRQHLSLLLNKYEFNNLNIISNKEEKEIKKTPIINKRPTSSINKNSKESIIAKEKKKIDLEEIRKKRDEEELALFNKLEEEQLQRELYLAKVNKNKNFNIEINNEEFFNEVENLKFKKKYNEEENYKFNNEDKKKYYEEENYKFNNEEKKNYLLDPEELYWLRKFEAEENKKRFQEEINTKNPFLYQEEDLNNNKNINNKKNLKNEISNEERRLIWEQQQKEARLNRIKINQELGLIEEPKIISSPRLLSLELVEKAKNQYESPKKVKEQARSRLSKIKKEVDLVKEALNLKENISDDSFDEQIKIVNNNSKKNESLFYRAETLREELEKELGIEGLMELNNLLSNDGIYNLGNLPKGFSSHHIIKAQQLLILDEALQSINQM